MADVVNDGVHSLTLLFSVPLTKFIVRQDLRMLQQANQELRGTLAQWAEATIETVFNPSLTAVTSFFSYSDMFMLRQASMTCRSIADESLVSGIEDWPLGIYRYVEIQRPLGSDGKLSFGFMDRKIRRSFSTVVRGAIVRGRPSAVAILFKQLEREDDFAREFCAQCLANIGSPALAASLTKYLQEPSPAVRRALLRSYGNLKDKINDESLARIMQIACCDENMQVRWDAAQMVGDLGRGSGNQTIIDGLAACLGDDDECLRARSIDGLVSVASSGTSESCLETIVKSLDDSSWKVRTVALEGIATLASPGPQLRKLVKRVRKCLKDKDEDVRDAAEETLEHLQGLN